MKKTAVLSFAFLALTSCDKNTPQTNSANTNVAVVVNRNQPETVAAHSTEKSLPPMNGNAANPSNKSASGSTESPQARAIDVSVPTAKIEAAEKEFKAKSSDAKAKENLATAYFDRAFLLTDAAQYRAALGDFRKGLKLNPNDAEAKKMQDQIIRIFASMKREPPNEGEEPAPMPFSK